MATTDSAAVAADLRAYFSKRLLDITGKDAVLSDAAYREKIPKGSGKSIDFTQYARLATPGAVLTDGVTPSDTALAPTKVSATIDQWGAYVTLSDLAELTVEHPIVDETTMLLGEQATETTEKAINTVLVAGTNVQYANSRASRATVTITDVITTTELRKAVKGLKSAGVRKINAGDKFDNNTTDTGKYYVLYVDSSVAMDIIADPEFRAANTLETSSLKAGKIIGLWYGVMVVESNVIPSIASTATVHTSYLIGRNAYAVTDLQEIATYVEGPGGTNDPLNQRRTIGWKAGFKAVILNNSFMVRIESGSAY